MRVWIPTHIDCLELRMAPSPNAEQETDFQNYPIRIKFANAETRDCKKSETPEPKKCLKFSTCPTLLYAHQKGITAIPAMPRSRKERCWRDVQGHNRCKCMCYDPIFPPLTEAWGAEVVSERENKRRARRGVGREANAIDSCRLAWVHATWPSFEVEQHAVKFCWSMHARTRRLNPKKAFRHTFSRWLRYSCMQIQVTEHSISYAMSLAEGW